MNKLIIVALLLACCAAVHAQVRVELFVDAPVRLLPIPGVDVAVFDLSAPERAKREYSPAFSPDITIARQQAEQFFKTPNGIAYVNRLKDANHGKILSLQYGLKKIPAIVFDEGRYAVYGTTDIAKAVVLYRRYLQGAREDE